MSFPWWITDCSPNWVTCQPDTWMLIQQINLHTFQLETVDLLLMKFWVLKDRLSTHPNDSIGVEWLSMMIMRLSRRCYTRSAHLSSLHLIDCTWWWLTICVNWLYARKFTLSAALESEDTDQVCSMLIAGGHDFRSPTASPNLGLPFCTSSTCRRSSCAHPRLLLIPLLLSLSLPLSPHANYNWFTNKTLYYTFSQPLLIHFQLFILFWAHFPQWSPRLIIIIN